jgi:molecular chaperone Hsp33
VHDRCSCSRDKLHGVLSGFSAEEITSTIENGEIRVECEFCSTVYKFDPSEFLRPN